MKKKILTVIAAAAIIVFAVYQCSPSAEEAEENLQIENVERLSSRPTYYVNSVSDNEDGTYHAHVYRKNTADGTIPDSLAVNFYERLTPSVAYLKAGDSIKIDLEVVTDEYRLDGRYQIFKTYEASLFIFVDQIPVLTEKYKQDN